MKLRHDERPDIYGSGPLGTTRQFQTRITNKQGFAENQVTNRRKWAADRPQICSVTFRLKMSKIQRYNRSAKNTRVSLKTVAACTNPESVVWYYTKNFPPIFPSQHKPQSLEAPMDSACCISSRRKIFPAGDFGIVETKATRRTFLYGATCLAT